MKVSFQTVNQSDGLVQLPKLISVFQTTLRTENGTQS
jgi:hypothetical protein